MERFRKKVFLAVKLPNSVALDVAHKMVEEARSLEFDSNELTFYMGDIAYDRLMPHMEATITRETESEKLFGIKVTRLSSMTNDPETLILEANRPDPKYIYHNLIAKGVAYDSFCRTASIKSKIKKVIFNDPATIILWKDGTKTVVQAQGEDFDPEKGMAMAIAKKALGNEGNYYNIFKEWLPEEEEEDVLSQIKKKLDEGEFFNPFEGFSHIFKMGDCEIEINPKEIKKGNKDAN